jgi:energy-coupling factor transporter ATP-binding protein EcfA2
VAILGDLGLVLEVIGWFAPLGGAFQALAIVPFAVLSSRHRLRAGVVAAVSAASVAFIVGGVGIVLQTFLASTVGIAIGTTHRRSWSSAASVGITMLVAGLPIALVTVVIDWISPGFRRLTFAQARIIVRDVQHLLGSLGETRPSRSLGVAFDWIVGHWWFTVPVAELAVIGVVAVVCLRMRPFLRILAASALGPYTGGVSEREGDRSLPVAPVPARFDSVSYRYPGAQSDALAGVEVTVAPGRLLAVVGKNGSGKSTLVRVLAGRLDPTAGRVERPGRPGYGEQGGTAMVFQRPESQVLGVRVRDDLAWGLGTGEAPLPEELLGLVGLEGMEDRETSTLSGGQLQRLAIAAALARRPALLVSDESTAMVDADGREEIVALLERLRGEGIAVVHVTHRRAETGVADVVLEMAEGRATPLAAMRDGWRPESRGAGRSRDADESAWGRLRRERLVRLRGVGYVYAAGTPWSHRALSGLDLDVERGEGIVVTGANGSGKTTLAWILGGLMAPTEGIALIGPERLDAAPARVAVSFQHARLQLMRATVLRDVAIGADEAAARAALAEVGLDPDEFGPRRVDDLSGGEQRRVALAGLLVRRPELLVLDEPYAGLDDDARLALAVVLRNLRRHYGISTVVVSHDLDNAEMLGDRVVRLDAGRILAEEVLAK